MKKPLRAIALPVAATLLCATQHIANAAAPTDPAPVAGEHLTVDVHQGTSMAVVASPDGRWLAIDLQGSIWIVPARGGRARRITDYFGDARQPTWTPDGRRLVFFAYRAGTYDLWSIAPDGSDMRQLTDGAADDRDPMVSPDGRFVAFASDRPGAGSPAYHIWTLELATGALRQVTAAADEDRLPSWSRDGREIAFSRQRGPIGPTTLMAAPAAGGTERMVQGGKARLDAPSWGPTGQLAYVAADAIGSRLMLDGTPVSGAENVFPFRVSWQRDGKGFYYVADGEIRHRVGAPSSIEPSSRRLAADALGISGSAGRGGAAAQPSGTQLGHGSADFGKVAKDLGETKSSVRYGGGDGNPADRSASMFHPFGGIMLATHPKAPRGAIGKQQNYAAAHCEPAPRADNEADGAADCQRIQHDTFGIRPVFGTERTPIKRAHRIVDHLALGHGDPALHQRRLALLLE